jgi:phage shock protein A
MKVLRRLFKIGQAETHSAIDKLEDPIKMIEQGLRDMQSNQESAMRSLAEVKAMHIRRKKELKDQESLEADLHDKSMLLLKKAQQGEINSQEADELVKENIKRKSRVSKEILVIREDVANLEKQVATLEQNVSNIKTEIKQWENELRTLKARVKVSSATIKINKQMTSMDSAGVVSMLERMKEKVLQDEALAEAYGEMAAKTDSEVKLDQTLQALSVEDELKQLKAQMGIQNQSAE